MPRRHLARHQGLEGARMGDYRGEPGSDRAPVPVVGHGCRSCPASENTYPVAWRPGLVARYFRCAARILVMREVRCSGTRDAERPDERRRTNVARWRRCGIAFCMTCRFSLIGYAAGTGPRLRGRPSRRHQGRRGRATLAEPLRLQREPRAVRCGTGSQPEERRAAGPATRDPGLGDVGAADLGGAVEVGDGARDAQHAVVAARGEVHALGRAQQQLARG